VADKVDDKILRILGNASPRSLGEWSIACNIYDWGSNRAKHGAWIRVVVQALWRLESRGLVGYFWQGHGDGAAGDRIWFKR